MMNQKIKKHFKDNKKAYVTMIATAVTISIVIYVFITRDGTIIKDSFNTHTKTVIKDNTVKITNNLIPHDNPAYVIYDPESRLYWVSQNEFAKAIGTTASHVSKYFNGNQDDILGMKPIRLGHSMVPNQEILTTA